MEPNISLKYNSSNNNILGSGWKLDGLSYISRCGARRRPDGFTGGVNYDEKDRFCLDDQRLILISTNKKYGETDTEYRTEINNFSKIVYKKDANGNSFLKYGQKTVT